MFSCIVVSPKLALYIFIVLFGQFLKFSVFFHCYIYRSLIFRLVLRIRVDGAARCDLGLKFGVFPEDAEPLLVAARDLGLNVVGVSFHVGSGCLDPSVFYKAIASSKMVCLAKLS